MRRIDSAHSTWLFDSERMRFCRLPRGVDPSSITLEREWQPYFGLEIDTHKADAQHRCRSCTPTHENTLEVIDEWDGR